MTAPLSYTSRFGYFGLRENPTFEQAVGTVRKPLGIPLPERKAKWEALGPYRNYLEDAERAYNERMYNTYDYRESGAHLPESAARVRSSMAGDDPVFDRIHRHGDAMDEGDAYEAAFDVMNREHLEKVEQDRRQYLRQSHGSNMTHPTIYAAREELGQAGVHHWLPAPRTQPDAPSFSVPPLQYAAAGHPQAREFTDFRVLNMEDPASVRAGRMTVSQNTTYERLRDSIAQHGERV